MAVNNPIWSYGKSRLINCAVTDPDSAWNYGENELRYEYIGPGEWCWGHDTGVAEKYIGNLVEGTGTSTVSGTGNDEYLTIDDGKYWLFPAVQTGTVEIKIGYDKYQAGSGNGSIQYRTGANKGACETTPWNNYTAHFTSLEWIQVRVLVGFVPSGSPIGWWPAGPLGYFGLEDGDPVGTWPDQSGNGNDIICAEGKRPVYKTNIQNGKPVVRFDGSSVGITGNIDLTGTDAIAIFLVWMSNVAAERVLLEYSEIYHSYTDSFHLANLGSKRVRGALEGDAGFSEWITNAAMTSFSLITTILDKSQGSGDEVKMYVNGALDGGADQSNDNTNNFGNRALHVGGRGTLPDYGVLGDVAELILYPVSEGRSANEAGLNAKYAIY